MKLNISSVRIGWRLIAAASMLTLALDPGVAFATIDASLQLETGNPSGATADPNNHDHYLISRTVEALDFSDNLGQSTWASWDLTAPDMGSSGRSSTFYTDTTLPAGFYEVKSSDYTDSGFDRGHECPSDDRSDTDADNKLVFYMTNVMPQTPDNNEGVWESFESYCQTSASSGNELLIQTGPSLFTGSRIQPSGKASIPGYTWKIALIVPAGSGTAASRVTPTTRIISIKIPNISGIRSNPWTQYVTAGNQIASDTGYTFLSALPASTARVLLAKVDGAAAPTLTGFSPTSGAVGASVVIAGANFTSASSVLFNGVSAAFAVNSATQITATVPSGASTGSLSVIAPGGLVASASSFTVTAGGGGGGGLTISQVYGGGGNSGSTYENDFIELYNPGSSTVNLSTYAVQYASSTGSTWSATNLSGSIAPGHYYLVQEAAGGGGTTPLPTPEATGSINLSSSSGKVALTNTQTLLNVSNPVGASAVVDFVGFGAANAYEGSGPAPTLSATTAALRAGAGATDTNNNAADFSAGAPNPRH